MASRRLTPWTNRRGQLNDSSGPLEGCLEVLGGGGGLSVNLAGAAVIDMSSTPD